jgi:transposase
MRPLATRFRLRLRWVRALLTRYRTPGDVALTPQGGGYPAKLDAPGLDALQPLVHAPPEATLQELRTRLSATQQGVVSPAALSRALTNRGLCRPKNLSRRRARAARGPTATGGVSRHPHATRP